MIIDLILFILLLASCGNLVPRAVELEKTYKYEKKSTNPNIFALYFGVVSILQMLIHGSVVI